MGKCLTKIKCPECGHKSLQIFTRDEDDTVDGYCFACARYFRNPIGDKSVLANSFPTPEPKSEAEIQAEIAEVDSYPTLDLVYKKLGKDRLASFGIKTAVSEVDGKTPELIYYPYTRDGKIVGYKVKLIPKEGMKKKMWAIGSLKDVDLFGWEQALTTGAKRLIITEGEDDAVAVTAILDRYTKNDYKEYKPAVVSLHSGSSSVKSLSKLKKKIQTYFKEIIFCFDMDEPGRLAVEEGLKIFPGAKSADLPSKDASQCILDGRMKAAFNALTFNFETPKNTKLVFGEDLHIEARQPPTYGELTWPWSHINEATRGIRYGETIYLGAGVKMGKSEVLNALAAHFIQNHGVKVFMAKPEEANNKTYKLIAGKIVGEKFHDPKVEFNYEQYDVAGEILKGHLAMINLYQHLGWNTLREDILSAVHWGAKVVFIDPITNLTNGINSGDANTILQEVAQDLAAMALDNNIVIFIFCHLKAPEGNIAKEKRDAFYKNGKFIGLGNCPHELGGDISSAQFAGSRAMMRSCNMMIGIEGNKDDEISVEERNVRHLVLLEDREFGETGRFPIYWNPKTTLFEEIL